MEFCNNLSYNMTVNKSKKSPNFCNKSNLVLHNIFNWKWLTLHLFLFVFPPFVLKGLCPTATVLLRGPTGRTAWTVQLSQIPECKKVCLMNMLSSVFSNKAFIYYGLCEVCLVILVDIFSWKNLHQTRFRVNETLELSSLIDSQFLIYFEVVQILMRGFWRS